MTEESTGPGHASRGHRPDDTPRGADASPRIFRCLVDPRQENGQKLLACRLRLGRPQPGGVNDHIQLVNKGPAGQPEPGDRGSDPAAVAAVCPEQSQRLPRLREGTREDVGRAAVVERDLPPRLGLLGPEARPRIAAVGSVPGGIMG